MFADILVRSNSFEQLIVWMIVIVVAAAILYAVIQYSGINIPPLFVKIIWLVLGAVFAILAVRLLFSL